MYSAHFKEELSSLSVVYDMDIESDVLMSRLTVCRARSSISNMPPDTLYS